MTEMPLLHGEWVTYVGDPLRWAVFCVGAAASVSLLRMIFSRRVRENAPDGLGYRVLGGFLLTLVVIYTELLRYGKPFGPRLFVAVLGVFILLRGNWKGVRNIENTTRTSRELEIEYIKKSRGHQ